jgi:ABC-type antimicrobial peptide transport system permease subunit
MRLLPINLGVHTILDLICAFLLGILFLKMPILSTIRAILIITILLLATEFINVFTMTSIFGQEQFNNMMNNSLQKALIGLPAAIAFALLIIISYFVFRKKSDKNGENGA